jgi:hypothetical protein
MPPVRLRPQPFLVEKHSGPGSKDFRAFYFKEVSMEAMDELDVIAREISSKLIIEDGCDKGRNL